MTRALALLRRLAHRVRTGFGIGSAGRVSRPKPDALSAPAPERSVVTSVRQQAAADLPQPIGEISPQTPATRAYRRAGAGHLYDHYAERIYKGKLPPLVYAIAVVETHLDARGNVQKVTFMRAPTQAPEVSLEIVQLITKASPLPSPGRLGAHTYVETWLWDESGHFQLDTLTEGQRSH